MTKGYSAKWIISADGNVYEDCTLIVDEGKVDKIIKTSELEGSMPKHLKDYGNSVITPGFISLHNHLQYTNIGKTSCRGFANSLKKLFINLKRAYFLGGINKNSFVSKIANLLSEYFCWQRSDKLNSFKEGIQKSLLAGTTCVAQLSKETKYFDILNEAPIKTYLFFELFSDSSETSKEEFRSIQKKIEKFLKQKSENTFVGVAPHSICCVHKRLIKTLVKYCRKNNILMTMRISESQDELDWVKFGFSDVDLINIFTGIHKFEPFMKGVSPVNYLSELGAVNKKLLASYCNFATDEDLETMFDNECALAYCPRISQKLHNKVLPFDKVLKYFPRRFGFGVNSLAFNDDLSLLNELRSVNNGHLNAREAIQYLTIVPAKILRLEHLIGSLENGKDADFNVFKLNDSEDYNAVLDKQNPDFVYVKGVRYVDNGVLRHKI